MPEPSEPPSFFYAKDTSLTVGVSESPELGPEKAEVEAWIRTIQNTERWRDSVGQNLGWRRYIQEFKTDWNFLQKSVSIPIVPINLVYAYTKTEIARLYFKDPWITVNPKRTEDLGASQIAEQVINYVWGELNLKHEIKQALLEAILVGHSWIKVGYVAEFGTVESKPKESGQRGPGRPRKAMEVETCEFIKSENAFAYQVPYKDIVFDPSATYPAPHNARWMAHRIVKPIRAICESGIYEHADEVKASFLVPDSNVPFETPGSSQEGEGQDVKSAMLWEIYDLDNHVVKTVSPGCPRYLRQIPYPDYLSGQFPFVMLAFNPVPGETFPLSDVAAHEGLSIEATKIVAIWLNHLKRWNRQMIVDPDLFTREEEAKFKDGNDGAIIKASVGPAAAKIFIPPYPPVQQDSYQIYNEVMRLWQIVSGQTPAEQGGQARVPTRTLGELKLALQGSRARADEKVDVLEDFLEEVARKLLGIMQKKYDLPKIARIVGSKSVQEKILGVLPSRPSAQNVLPNGEPNPITPMTSDFSFSWSRQDILGDMDVGVVAGSTVPMDRESQLEVLEKLIPMLPAAGVTPGSPAAKAYAREIFRLVGIKSVETIIDLVDQQEPQPSPGQMETEAKVKAIQAETQAKLQGRAEEEKIKLQAMHEKLDIQRQTAKMDMEKNIINSILEKARMQNQPMGPVNGNSF